MQNSTGYEAAKAKAESLKSETEKEKTKEETAANEILAEFRTSLGIPEKLAVKYKADAGQGAESLGDSLPSLKVHYVNQSVGNELSDGKEPNNGWFYHTKLHEQFEEVTCNILLISRGFNAKKLNPKPGEKPLQFQQIIAGVLRQDNVPTAPFLFWVKGLSLSPMWEFGRNIKPLTAQLPIYALIVKLKNKQVTTEQGNRVFVLEMSLVRDKDGKPAVVSDEGEYVYLKEMYGQIKHAVDSIVESKSEESPKVPLEEPPHPADTEQFKDDLNEVLGD